MNTKSNKSGILKVLVLVVSLVVLAFSATYAYYTTSITGDSSETVLKSGKLEITTNLESVSAINNSNIILINASEKEEKADSVTFYISNPSTSTIDAKYYVYLTDINLSKNLYSEYFKWELLKNDEVVNSGTFKNASRKTEISEDEENNVLTTSEDIQLNSSALYISPNTTDTLVFRLWLENDDSKNQIELTEGSFSGKLYLEAVPSKDTTSSTTSD
jgi:hypothetical protein